MQAFPVMAGRSFRAGEPVVVRAEGDLNEASTDPSIITGIAAHGAIDGRGNRLPGGSPVTVYGTSPGQVFITKKFKVAGTETAPVQTNIGDLVGMKVTGGVWFLDTGAGNLNFRVTGVQDISGRDIADPNTLAGTGVWVLFTST
jgi:hypothetical protein